MKETKIILSADGVEREFTPIHAEKLLRMKHNGGWKLCDPRFEFTEEKGITKKKPQKEENND